MNEALLEGDVQTKNCPCCNSSLIRHSYVNDMDGHGIQCQTCGLIMIKQDEDIAQDMWNKRPNPWIQITEELPTVLNDVKYSKFTPQSAIKVLLGSTHRKRSRYYEKFCDKGDEKKLLKLFWNYCKKNMYYYWKALPDYPKVGE